MMPLISSQVSSSEGTWWLLDSGAATSVLSQNYEGMYRCQAQEDSAGALETYYAANGTPVHMRANVLVSLAFQVVTGASGKKKIQSFKLACCIGDVSHNIISTTQLVKKGWSVIQSPGETYLYHEDSGTLISDVLLWGGTPWLRACRAAQPSLKDGSQPMELVESSVVEPEGLKVSMVGAVELSSQEKLRQHVLRGHYPFDPHCLECQQGRGVSRAPRRSLRERILEVQVDFFFLGLVESKFKMILLRQVFSGLLGVTAVSENVQVTGQHLRQILAEFGLLETLEGPPVDFRTDAQDEVGTVLRRSGLPRDYTVNKAGPQNHDTVGSVERGVREVKEALAVLRLELAKAGLDLVDSLVAWEAASRYVTAMHNLHGKIQNTGKTGKELLRNTSEGTRISAMFCSRVLAETPESVDSIGRFVTAAYLYPVRNSFAHFVCAKIADELKFFQAKSLKLVFRLSIHKISLNVLFVTQVQVIIHRLLIRHPLRFCQRSLHDFQIRCSPHDTGLMLMDELKDAVRVPLDKVDIPRSAVSAIGIGSVTRRREKCQLCPTSLRSNYQELSPMTQLWPCLHDHCRASQVCLLG